MSFYSPCALHHRKGAWLCCWAVLHPHHGCIQPWLQISLFVRREATLKKEKSRTFCVLKGMENMLVQFDPESFPHASVGEAGSPVALVPMFLSSGLRLSHRSREDPKDRQERGRKHTSIVELDMFSGYFQT